MVLGDHGRKVLFPMTLAQKFAVFPWAKYYNNSLYFKSVCGCAAVVGATWAYILLKGADVSFTPYTAVHHSISHKFAHDLDHARYPVEHKKH